VLPDAGKSTCQRDAAPLSSDPSDGPRAVGVIGKDNRPTWHNQAQVSASPVAALLIDIVV